MIKAIETSYKGYRFRSRLEARWAVFFDTLGIRYQYEPEAFEIESWLGNGGKKWVYLPDFYLPDSQTWVEVKGTLDDLRRDYLEMISWAVDWNDALPGVYDSYGTTRGLLWLGPIPPYQASARQAPLHVILQHGKGGWCNHCHFCQHELLAADTHDSAYFDAMCEAKSKIRGALTKYVYGEEWYCNLLYNDCCLMEAYSAARSARFDPKGKAG